MRKFGSRHLGGQRAIAVNPKGDAVYISTGGAIDIVNPATEQITGTIPITANAIAFSPNGAHAYVETVQDGVPGLAVVDTETLAVSGFIPGINPLPVCGDHGCTGTGGGEALAVRPDGGIARPEGSLNPRPFPEMV